MEKGRSILGSQIISTNQAPVNYQKYSLMKVDDSSQALNKDLSYEEETV